jgi:hypothetical protein
MWLNYAQTGNSISESVAFCNIPNPMSYGIALIGMAAIVILKITGKTRTHTSVGPRLLLRHRCSLSDVGPPAGK